MHRKSPSRFIIGYNVTIFDLHQTVVLSGVLVCQQVSGSSHNYSVSKKDEKLILKKKQVQYLNNNV